MPLGAAMAISTAVSAGVAGVGWFASPFVSKLLEHNIFQGREEEGESKKDLPQEMERLRALLPQIESIAAAAEERQFKDSRVRHWLRKLKEALHDAEDVLDQHELQLLLAKERGEPNEEACFPLPVAEQINAIVERLHRILEDGAVFGFMDKALSPSSTSLDPELLQKRETTSSLRIGESTFVGRDHVKEEIIKHLVPHMEKQAQTHHHLERFSALVIVGMGGLGKTTLAKFVFNDEKVAAFYGSRAWVYVGQSDALDPKKTMASIIDSLRADQGKKACNASTLEALQRTLVAEIKDPFLLVLDDAWDANSSGWEMLLGVLKDSKKRCRVVVTTRNEKVADAVGDDDGLQVRRLGLDLLDKDSMWSTFAKFAALDGSKHPELERIGRDIVERLNGLPLAAKTIGSILRRNRKAKDWESILLSEQLVNKRNEGTDFMLPVLMLSYCCLPAIAKRYFSCFSLFPKGYEFGEYTRRGLHYEDRWMIQRLFLIGMGISSQGEYDASECVDELLGKSLLQCVNDGVRIIVSVHDLIHDMAEMINKEEFIRISDASKKESIPEKIQHISIFQHKFDPELGILKNLAKYKSLRTLLYDNRNERIQDSSGLLDGWFGNLRYLRVLSLYNYHITVLPDSIGNLKLLHYLDLFLPKIKELPSAISRLQKLQGLNLRGCDSLHKLPSSVTRLVNLIHLDVDPMLLETVDGIGQFKNLQELEKFHVEERQGHGISQLKDMNELCGSLSIFNLERVKDRGNAKIARLDQKKKLERLELFWSSNQELQVGVEESQVDVFEGLRPHTILNQLSIAGYRGKHLPNWLIDLSLISLSRLHVGGCPNLEDIPSLPSTLRSLSLCYNSGLKSLFSSSPPSISAPPLQRLRVIGCGQLDKSLNVVLEASSSSLEYLEIKEYNCPLEGLYHVTTTLSELKLRNCKKEAILNHEALFLLAKMEIENCQNMVVREPPVSSEKRSSLTHLTIRKSPQLFESLSQCSGVLDSLSYLHVSSECDDSTVSNCLRGATALKNLCLTSCTNITSLPSHLMHKLAAIETLEVRDCHKLVELAFPPVANISVTISGCPNLSFGGSSPHRNPAIKHLNIGGFSWEQVSELLSVLLLHTPILSITLRSCVITDATDALSTSTSTRGEIQLNTSLEVVEIFDCQGLSLDLSSLKSLKDLSIRNCSAISSLPVLSSLVFLSIENCPNLDFMSRETSSPFFPKLEILHATKSSVLQLTDLIKGLAKSPIKWITIAECDELESFDNGLRTALLEFKKSIFRLFIIDCCKLICLPTNLEVFEALLELEVSKCPQMLKLPNGCPPASLQLLQGRDCPRLKELHEQGHRWFSGISQVVFQ